MTTTMINADPTTVRQFPFCQRNGFQALLFDWDGVVVNSGADYFRAYELALEPEGLKLTPREVFIREGRRTGEVIAALFADRGISLTPAKLNELIARRKVLYEKTARRLFFDGIWELVGALRVSGYKLGLVTGSSRQHDVLPLTPERERQFDVVVTADDIRLPKPDPEPFEVAIRKLGSQPAECLVIENAPCGIESAHRAGCRVIALGTTLSAEDLRDADWVVAGHRELEALLAS